MIFFSNQQIGVQYHVNYCYCGLSIEKTKKTYFYKGYLQYKSSDQKVHGTQSVLQGDGKERV